MKSSKDIRVHGSHQYQGEKRTHNWQSRQRQVVLLPNSSTRVPAQVNYHQPSMVFFFAVEVASPIPTLKNLASNFSTGGVGS